MAKLKLKKAAAPSATSTIPPWKVLVVDDDPEVHAVTKMILASIRFEGRAIELLHAYSAAEAEEVLAQQNDIAIALLDVVMENDHAGLDLVKVIRQQLNNRSIRIILRTGQPGQAPEESVIVDYDINDYKAKNELTAQKLFTAVIASLRSYRDITSLERTRAGLEKIIDSSDKLFCVDSVQNLASGILHQLSAFIGCAPNGLACIVDDVSEQTDCNNSTLRILASTGNCQSELLDETTQGLIQQSLQSKLNVFGDGTTVIYLNADQQRGAVAVIHGDYQYSEETLYLLQLYSKNISLALANAINYSKMIRAEDAANLDFLTGLNNRRGFFAAARSLQQLHQRNAEPLTVAMLDIDHFKKVNDNYGHDAGDLVLTTLASKLKSMIRESDLLARFGGEEFCLMLPNTDKQGAEHLLEKLRIAICETIVVVDDTPISCTISIGASSQLANVDAMLQQADEHLYQAKQQGRNQTVIS